MGEEYTMLILNQDKTELINFDRITFISQELDEKGDTVDYVAHGDDYSITLGTYPNTIEQENVLEKIAERSGAVSVFYMPKGD